jgi:hypothetical protein
MAAHQFAEYGVCLASWNVMGNGYYHTGVQFLENRQVSLLWGQVHYKRLLLIYHLLSVPQVFLGVDCKMTENLGCHMDHVSY